MPRPPLPWLIAYRLLGVRLPDEYRAWVAHDVAAKNYVNWRILRTLLVLLVFEGLFYVAHDALWQPPASQDTIVKKILPVTVALSLLGSRKSYMRRARRWQRIDPRGNPVPPKGLGLLDNVGAVVAAVLVLTVFTAGSSLYAYSKRPAGCSEPAEATVARIRAAFKDPAYRLQAPHEVEFSGGSIIAGGVKIPGQDQPRYAFWLVRDGQIYDYAAKATTQATTTFDFPPTQDRIAVDAVVRASRCVQTELG